MSQPKPKHWEIPVKRITASARESYHMRTREGVKLEMAMRVYAELVSQNFRAHLLQDQMLLPLAGTAFKCAEAFIQVWDQNANQ